MAQEGSGSFRLPETSSFRNVRRPHDTTDESIVAFATVREEVMSSDPSFGDCVYPSDRPANHAYAEDVVPCMVEVTRGSPNKYEVDKETGMLVLDRVLHSAVHYPGDYGYIPATLCGDGDPLDLLIISPYVALSHTGLEPGTIANCRIVAIMDMEDESGRDEKVIGVLDGMRPCSHITGLDTIPPHLVAEIQHFFETYKKLEVKEGKPKWARILGWGDRNEALRVLAESRERYRTKLLETSAQPQRFHGLGAPNMLHAPQTDQSGVLCYINAKKGSSVAYQYRHDTSFRHYRTTLNMSYPGDSGWIAQTWQKEAKKPAAMIVQSVFPILSEALVHVRIIGALHKEYRVQGELRHDYTMIGVPVDDPRGQHLKTLSNINPAIIEHYEQFLTHCAQQDGAKDVKLLGWCEEAEANDVYRTLHQCYLDSFPNRRLTNAPNLWCLPWTADESTPGKPAMTAVIECPKGTCNKYEFNRELGSLVLQRPLYSATYWPGNYGFLPQTVAEDGRPVNVMVLSNHPLNEFSLCVVRIVGAVMCIDEKGPDLKVIAVPKKEPRMSEWLDVDDVPSHIKSELDNFFNTYKSLESNWRFCKVEQWKSAADTMEYLRLAHTRFFLFVLPMDRVEHRLKRLEEENAKLRAQVAKK